MTGDKTFKDIAHECKSCGAKWTVSMLMVGGDKISLPIYQGADTFRCPVCGSDNTVMYSDAPEVEPK